MDHEAFYLTDADEDLVEERSDDQIRAQLPRMLDPSLDVLRRVRARQRIRRPTSPASRGTSPAPTACATSESLAAGRRAHAHPASPPLTARCRSMRPVEAPQLDVGPRPRRPRTVERRQTPSRSCSSDRTRRRSARAPTCSPFDLAAARCRRRPCRPRHALACAIALRRAGDGPASCVCSMWRPMAPRCASHAARCSSLDATAAATCSRSISVSVGYRLTRWSSASCARLEQRLPRVHPAARHGRRAVDGGRDPPNTQSLVIGGAEPFAPDADHPRRRTAMIEPTLEYVFEIRVDIDSAPAHRPQRRREADVHADQRAARVLGSAA